MYPKLHKTIIKQSFEFSQSTRTQILDKVTTRSQSSLVIINSNIILWIPLNHSVALALISKQLFIFFFYCPNFMECRNTFFSKIFEMNSDLIASNDLAATIEFIVTSKRFDGPPLV